MSVTFLNSYHKERGHELARRWIKTRDEKAYRELSRELLPSHGEFLVNGFIEEERKKLAAEEKIEREKKEALERAERLAALPKHARLMRGIAWEWAHESCVAKRTQLVDDFHSTAPGGQGSFDQLTNLAAKMCHDHGMPPEEWSDWLKEARRDFYRRQQKS